MKALLAVAILKPVICTVCVEVSSHPKLRYPSNSIELDYCMGADFLYEDWNTLVPIFRGSVLIQELSEDGKTLRYKDVLERSKFDKLYRVVAPPISLKGTHALDTIAGLVTGISGGSYVVNKD